MENSQVVTEADSLYQELQDAGMQVLYDDRSETAGVKFNDADLLGLPVRLVVSPRNLRQSVVEIKRRFEAQGTTVPRDQAVAKAKELLPS